MLATRALEIPDSLVLWKAYDSMYLALAEREARVLWTGDTHFWNAARLAFPRIRH